MMPVLEARNRQRDLRGKGDGRKSLTKKLTCKYSNPWTQTVVWVRPGDSGAGRWESVGGKGDICNAFNNQDKLNK